MRGDQVQGRFTIASEKESIKLGVTKDMVRTVGMSVDWWAWDSVASQVDPIYDVGSSTVGRRWKKESTLPVISAKLEQGVMQRNDRGLYTVDQLRLTFNIDVIRGDVSKKRNSYFGNTTTDDDYFSSDPDRFLRDRIVFRNTVWSPAKFLPRGLMGEDYTFITMDLNQVNPEELVNDPQFLEYSNYNPFSNGG
jgi:hypothetical protein